MAYQDVKTPWEGWHVIKQIGKGGFGSVYEIERSQYGIQERAAMKVITIPQSADEIDDLLIEGYDDNSITQRFDAFAEDIVQEYGKMAQMKGNANIVYCDDYSIIQQDNGFGRDIYIRMELLTPLLKAMDRVSSEAQIIRFGMEMCNALEACQKRKVIHRDIKPQNIFVSDDGVFKLGDFGIARKAEKTTRATVGKGTYQFMAPEVKNELPYGPTVDIYSLGLVMYWLLNNRRGPFFPLPPTVPTHKEEQEALRRRFSGEKIPEPKNGSEELKRIVLKACAFDPKARYQSAWEMLDALDALRHMETVPDKIASASAPELIPDSVDEVGETVGPDWDKKVSDKDTDQNYQEIDEEKTVGPVFVQQDKTKQEKKKRQRWPVLVACLVLVVVGAFLLPKGSEVPLKQTDEDPWVSVRESFSLDGSVIQFSEAEYDSAGNLIKTLFYNVDGTLDQHVIIEYDLVGNQSKFLTYNTDGILSGWRECNYDTLGNLIEELHYKEDGELYANIVHKYDTLGNQIESVHENEEGAITRCERSFDMSGNVTEVLVYGSDGVLYYQDVYEYNSFGNVIKVTRYDTNGEIFSWTEYEYDSEENLIKWIQYVGSSVYVYEYEYARLSDVHTKNKSNNVQEDVHAEGDENILMSDVADLVYDETGNHVIPPVFGTDIMRDQVRRITFLDTLSNAPDTAWDVSRKKNGSVMAWVESSGELHDLFIAGDGGVTAPENCMMLFAEYTNLEEIKFNGCFDTTNTVNMSRMFYYCDRVRDLDLSDFETGNVATMHQMFNGCSSLGNLDISGFETSNVQMMSGMFALCWSLSELDVTSFDTSSVTDMSNMFFYCRNLSELDLSRFDTSNVTDMRDMFNGCDNLDIGKIGLKIQ